MDAVEEVLKDVIFSDERWQAHCGMLEESPENRQSMHGSSCTSAIICGDPESLCLLFRQGLPRGKLSFIFFLWREPCCVWPNDPWDRSEFWRGAARTCIRNSCQHKLFILIAILF